MKAIDQANEAERNVAILTDLPSVIFTLSGDTVRRWCNGMFSNNIRKLSPGQGNLSAICNDRGFVSDFIHCFCSSDELFVCILERHTIEPFLERFRSFLFLDDIDLDELEHPGFSIIGPNADETVLTLGLTPPEEQYATENDIRLIRVNRGIQGIDVYAPQTILDNLRQKAIDKEIAFINPEAFDLLRIRKGRAISPTDIDGKTLIHNLGLNEICCAFDKGCYVGQEIINRIDVKGTNNKLIHRFFTSGNLKVGDAVILNKQRVGKISSIANEKDGLISLAVVRKSAWGQEKFTTDSGVELLNLDL